LRDKPIEPIYEGQMGVNEIIEQLDGGMVGWLKPDHAFIQTVKKFGVIEPIILTQHIPAGKSNYAYHVRDGKRRLQAALVAGTEVITVRVFVESEVTGEAITLVTNSQRSENPAAEYLAIKELIDLGKVTNRAVTYRDIATVTGMTVQTIKKRMEFAKLNVNLFEALVENRISRQTAEQAAKMTMSQQAQLVTTMRENKGKLPNSAVREAKMVGAAQYVQELPINLGDGEPELQSDIPPDDTDVCHDDPDYQAMRARLTELEAAAAHIVEQYENVGSMNTPRFKGWLRDTFVPLVKGEPE
jgi:ParB/RepB/Spo0J family partition protein